MFAFLAGRLCLAVLLNSTRAAATTRVLQWYHFGLGAHSGLFSQPHFLCYVSREGGVLLGISSEESSTDVISPINSPIPSSPFPFLESLLRVHWGLAGATCDRFYYPGREPPSRISTHLAVFPGPLIPPFPFSARLSTSTDDAVNLYLFFFRPRPLSFFATEATIPSSSLWPTNQRSPPLLSV